MPDRPSVEEIYCHARALPARERVDYLQRLALDEEALAEVESLLAAAEAASDFLEQPVSSAFSAQDPLVGEQFGPYQVTGVIATGGMGAVYQAKRVDRVFERKVAVKLIRQGMLTDDALRRFQLERQTLAELRHPNIAQLLDGGATEAGIPYLIMELVDGQPIDSYCETHQLSVDQRLQLFLQVCDAVHHAHEHGVVHRDIKPANILVQETLASNDAVGDPKLLDFGIAKLLAEGKDPELTAIGMRMLTARYASPEAFLDVAAERTTDVYSLGVILYELLTGQWPYPSDDSVAIPYARVIAEVEPVRPSRAVATATARSDKRSDGRSTTEKRLQPRLVGDLDNIILMALRKEPERRYSSAAEFARDIRRHLEHQPVIARPPTLGYRARKFVRRHPVPLFSASVFVIAALLGILAWRYDQPINVTVEAGDTFSTQENSAIGANDSIVVNPGGTFVVQYDLNVEGRVWCLVQSKVELRPATTVRVGRGGRVILDTELPESVEGVLPAVEIVDGGSVVVPHSWAAGTAFGSTLVAGVGEEGPSKLLGKGGGAGADLRAGFDRPGVIQVLDGGVADFGDDLSVGTKGAEGTVTVRGMQGGRRATIELIRGKDACIRVGRGKLLIEDGGLVRVGQRVEVGLRAGLESSVVVRGAVDGVDALLEAGGSLTAGRPIAATGTGTVFVGSGGRLAVGEHVTIHKGSRIHVAGGVLRAAAVRNGGGEIVVGGDILVEGALVNAGTVTARGQGRISGSFAQEPSGRLSLTVGGGSSALTALAVTGRVNLGGELTVELLDGTVPVEPQTLVTGSAVTGRFELCSLPTGFDVEYTDESVLLVRKR